MFSKIARKRHLFFISSFSILFFLLGIIFGRQLELKKTDNQKLNNNSTISFFDSFTSKIPEFVDKDINFSLYWDVWQSVKEKFYQQNNINDKDLFYGSLKGMVRALNDPYTVFFNPDEAAEFNKELKGRFEGIGAEIGIKHDRLTIIAPLPNTPADKVGLRPGDKIFLIDDFDTTDIAIDEAVRRIRGPEGTEVVLTVLHKDEAVPVKITVTRGEIIIPTVSWELKGEQKDIAYLRVFSFIDTTMPDFKHEVNKILAQDPKALILDLRSNPGGYLDAAIDMAGFWIEPKKPVVLERLHNSKEQSYLSQGPAVFSNLNTIVLVNEGSASASEIVAGALRDWEKAIILGEQTFGKGSVQDYSALSGGAALKITIAEWLTPDGTCINKEGISPDVKVEMTSEDFNNDLDPQLDRALELLK